MVNVIQLVFEMVRLVTKIMIAVLVSALEGNATADSKIKHNVWLRTTAKVLCADSTVVEVYSTIRTIKHKIRSELPFLSTILGFSVCIPLFHFEVQRSIFLNSN